MNCAHVFIVKRGKVCEQRFKMWQLIHNILQHLTMILRCYNLQHATAKSRAQPNLLMLSSCHFDLTTANRVMWMEPPAWSFCRLWVFTAYPMQRRCSRMAVPAVITSSTINLEHSHQFLWKHCMHFDNLWHGSIDRFLTWHSENLSYDFLLRSWAVQCLHWHLVFWHILTEVSYVNVGTSSLRQLHCNIFSHDPES